MQQKVREKTTFVGATNQKFKHGQDRYMKIKNNKVIHLTICLYIKSTQQPKINCPEVSCEISLRFPWYCYVISQIITIIVMEILKSDHKK